MLTFTQFLELTEAQQRTSAKTSLNQVSAGIKKLSSNGTFKPEHTIVDVGGGKYDKGSEHIKHATGATSHVYDPYNRSKEHNAKVEADHTGKADHVMSHNVGNVIEHDSDLHDHLKKAKSFMKPNHGQFHMSVYEGDGKGAGRATQNDESFQRHAKLKEYVSHVKHVFPESHYKVHVAAGMIHATPN
jgi:hypothetical protein